MQFAKLYTYPTGQLLVTADNSDDSDHEDAPYQLVTETRYQGLTMRLAQGYEDEARRDAQFEALDEAKALDYFTKQQASLRQMAS